jgi:hypothetical protein
MLYDTEYKAWIRMLESTHQHDGTLAWTPIPSVESHGLAFLLAWASTSICTPTVTEHYLQVIFVLKQYSNAISRQQKPPTVYPLFDSKISETERLEISHTMKSLNEFFHSINVGKSGHSADAQDVICQELHTFASRTSQFPYLHSPVRPAVLGSGVLLQN